MEIFSNETPTMSQSFTQKFWMENKLSTDLTITPEEFGLNLGLKLNPFHIYKKHDKEIPLLSLLMGMKNLDYLKVWIQHVGILEHVQLPNNYAPLLHHVPETFGKSFSSIQPWRMLLQANAPINAVDKKGLTAFEFHLYAIADQGFKHNHHVVNDDLLILLGSPLRDQLWNKPVHRELSSLLLDMSPDWTYPEWVWSANEAGYLNGRTIDFLLSLGEATPKIIEKVHRNFQSIFKIMSCTGSHTNDTDASPVLINYLLDNGLDIQAEDEHGFNLGHYCLMGNHYNYNGQLFCPVPAIKILMERGLDFDRKNQDGWSVQERLYAVNWSNKKDLEALLVLKQKACLDQNTLPVQSTRKSPRL